MTVMIRKQVYIEPRQEETLKRVTEETGRSEAEIIREALDLWLQEAERRRRADQAWDEAYQFMVELHDRGPVAGSGRTWTRDAIYEERLNRYERRSG